MKKLSSTARILDTIAQIASVCCIVAVCLVAVAAIMLFAFSNDSMIEFTGLDLGNVTFELASVDMAMMKSIFLCELLPAVVLVAYGYMGLRIIRRILAPMKDGQPFDSTVSVNLKKLSWIILGGGICSQLFGVACGILMYKAFDFSALFLSDKITGVTLNLGMDLTCVLIFAIVYMLGCVFQYGEELQKQSDETL